MNGWIKLDRQILSDNMWLSEPFTRGQAWVDLLLLANHAYGYFYKRGVKVEIKRGEVGVSEVGLSDRWKWSRNKVRRFLNDLETEHQIEQQKNNVTLIISILKYDAYQGSDTPNETPKGTAERHQKDTNKKNKEEKECKEVKTIGEKIKIILEHWNSKKIIVHNKLSLETKDVIKKRLGEYTIQEALGAIDRYAESLNSEYEYCNFRWSLDKFMRQKNAVQDFMEDGSKWNNYLRWKESGKKSKVVEPGETDADTNYGSNIARLAAEANQQLRR